MINCFPLILPIRQCDQAKQGIVNTPSKMDDYVKEHGFAGWFETSAKENINIEEAARALVNKVISHFTHKIFEKKMFIDFVLFLFLVSSQILFNDKIINAGDLVDAEKFNLDGRNGELPKKKCSCWQYFGQWFLA